MIPGSVAGWGWSWRDLAAICQRCLLSLQLIPTGVVKIGECGIERGLPNAVGGKTRADRNVPLKSAQARHNFFSYDFLRASAPAPSRQSND